MTLHGLELQCKVCTECYRRYIIYITQIHGSLLKGQNMKSLLLRGDLGSESYLIPRAYIKI